MVLICKTLSSLHQGILCAKFDWNCSRNSEGEGFQISSVFFRSFVIICLKGLGPLLNKFKFSSPKELLFQVYVYFWNFDNVFSLFRYNLLLKKGVALHLNKLNLSPITTKDALCQVWLKLVQEFWRRRFSNFISVFSLFRNYLS